MTSVDRLPPAGSTGQIIPGGSPEVSAALSPVPLSATTSVSLESLGDMPKWKSLISAYNMARASLGLELCDKLDWVNLGMGEELTKEENEKVQLFIKEPSRRALLAEAEKLFHSAYNRLTGKMSGKGFSSLICLLDFADAALITEPGLKTFRRLINPDLTPADRKLAVSCVFEEDKGKRKNNVEKLVNRIAQDQVNRILGYDGVHAPDRTARGKSMNALWWAVDYFGDHVDQKVARLILSDLRISGIFSGDATAKGLIEALKGARTKTEKEAARNELLAYLNFLGTNSASQPVGSPKRIKAYQLAEIIRQHAIVNGLPYQAVATSQVSFNMAGLYGQDLSDMVTWAGLFSMVAESPEKTDNIKCRALLEAKIKETVGSYIDEKDVRKRLILLQVISFYGGRISDFGITIEEYRQLIKPIVDRVPRLAHKKGSNSVNFWDIMRNDLVIVPDDLPERIKANLRATGAWENVSKAAFIMLKSNIPLSGGMQQSLGGVSGLASGLFISLDIYNEATGHYYSEELLTSVLAHEGEHVGWFTEHYMDKLLMSSTIDERSAFAVDLRVSTYLLKKMIAEYQYPGEYSLNIMGELSSAICQSREAVMNANRVLGYPLHDYGPRTDIKDPLKDMDAYPAIAFLSADPEEFRSYVSKLGISVGEDFMEALRDPKNKITISFKRNNAETWKKFVASDISVEGLPEKYRNLFIRILIDTFVTAGAIARDDKDKNSRAMAVMLYLRNSEPSFMTESERKKLAAELSKAASSDLRAETIDFNSMIPKVLQYLKYHFDGITVLENMRKGREPFIGMDIDTGKDIRIASLK